MSDWRRDESVAWKVARAVFDREIGRVGHGVTLAVNSVVLKGYAVEAIMEFQKIMGEGAEAEGQLERRRHELALAEARAQLSLLLAVAEQFAEDSGDGWFPTAWEIREALVERGIILGAQFALAPPYSPWVQALQAELGPVHLRKWDE